MATPAAADPQVRWPVILLCIILGGAAVVLAHSARQLQRVQQALRWAREEDPRLRALALRCAAKFDAVPPQVAVVAAPIAPLLWMSRQRPMIVVPRHLADSLSDAQLSCILSHEIAHYVRRDHWINVASLLVAALFWWLPTAWWARRELRGAQELCCDALAIHRGSASRRVYATTIWQTLESMQTERPLLPALASGFGGKSSAVRRIEMIANPRVQYLWSWRQLPVLLLALLALPCLPVRGAADVLPDDLSPEVQQQIRTAVEDGRIIAFQQSVLDGAQVYQARVVRDDFRFDLVLTERGTLLSKVLVADPEDDAESDEDDDGREDDGAKDDRNDDDGDRDSEDREGDSEEDDDDEEERETPVKFEDLPEAVQKTLKRESAGGEIEELEKEVKGDRVIYCADVEYETDEGELLYDIEIAENGTLLFKILEEEEEEEEEEQEQHEKDDDEEDERDENPRRS
jgi:hypothetical protein